MSGGLEQRPEAIRGIIGDCMDTHCIGHRSCKLGEMLRGNRWTSQLTQEAARLNAGCGNEVARARYAEVVKPSTNS